ncbi:MAG: hypothetical protein WC799_19715 [Desulfobacteraceae bacterium]|jgi:hypothetical protein
MTYDKKILMTVLAVFLTPLFSYSAAHGHSNFLPSPFPMCTMDGATSGLKVKIDAMYSTVTADTTDIDYSGFSAMCVKENPEVGKPSFHYGLFGEIAIGDQADQISKENVEGYSVGVSMTPSFVLSDRVPGFRPSVFFGSSVQYQKLDIEKFQYSDEYSQFLFRTRWQGYANVSIYQEPKKKEMVQVGFYTGIYLDFRFGQASVSPFLMTQAVKGRAEWTYAYNNEDNYAYSYAVHTAGLELRLIHPGISILTMAQIMREKDEEDAEAYSPENRIKRTL